MDDSEFQALLELLAMLVTDPRTGVLMALLVAAAVYDCRSFRIPNWITGSGLVFGLAWTTMVPPLPGAGWTWPVAGMLLGFLAMLPLYLMRVVGAGDVKLMAMAGAFLGWYDTLFAMLFSMVAAGVAALGWAALRGVIPRMLENVRGVLFGLATSTFVGHRPVVYIEPGKSVGKLPYGASTAVATIAYLVARQLGFF
jgi:prepilin peptidase CpaA